MSSSASNFSFPLFNIIPLLIPYVYFNRFQARDAKRDPTAPFATIPINWRKLQMKIRGEWFAVNIVSACLLFANANLLRVEDISSQEVTRTATLMSLLSALISFISGSSNVAFVQPSLQRIYETSLMRARYPKIMFWNLWVLFTLPFIHLTWAVIQFLFVVSRCLLVTPDPAPPSYQPTYTVLVAGLISIICTLGVYYSVTCPSYTPDDGGQHELLPTESSADPERLEVL